MFFMFDQFKNMFKSEPKTRSQATILVVEDNAVFQQFLLRTLQKAGYKVELAENGQIGLDKAKILKPDLILLDCEMPVLGGVDMCKKLRETEGIYNTPVLFLTGLDTPKNIIDCFETDAENYLSKPISGKLLLSEIQKVLNEYSLK